MTVEEAKRLTLLFFKKHKGLGSLKIEIRDTVEELYDKKYAAINPTVLGSYNSDEHTIKIVASNNRTPKELFLTIKHELYGHLAINHLKPLQKLKTLNTIVKMKDTLLKKEWAKIKEYYPDDKVPQGIQAEEVFSIIAEKLPTKNQHTVMPKLGINTKNDLIQLIRHLKDEIVTGRGTQKTFPKNAKEQFRKMNDSKKLEYYKKLNEIKLMPSQRKVIDELIEHGGELTGSKYRKIAGFDSSVKASRHLKDLVEKGVLTQKGSLRHSTYKLKPISKIGIDKSKER
jgi:hypothetical protein